MACKLAVVRESRYKDFFGDCLGPYPKEKPLGKKVDLDGGAFTIYEVSDAEEDNPVLLALTEPYFINNPKWVAPEIESQQYMDHPVYNRRQHLNLIKGSDGKLPSKKVILSLSEIEKLIINHG